MFPFTREELIGLHRLAVDATEWNQFLLDEDISEHGTNFLSAACRDHRSKLETALTAARATTQRLAELLGAKPGERWVGDSKSLKV